MGRERKGVTMRHPNEDRGNEWIWSDLSKPETKDLAWWKGEVARLELALGDRNVIDLAALILQYTVAVEKVAVLERIAGIN